MSALSFSYLPHNKKKSENQSDPNSFRSIDAVQAPFSFSICNNLGVGGVGGGFLYIYFLYAYMD